MQLSVPEVTDLSTEKASTLKAYGADDTTNPIKAGFAKNCILARRLLEKGVRFVQLFNGAYQTGGEGVSNWDGHKVLHQQYANMALCSTNLLPRYCATSNNADYLKIRWLFGALSLVACLLFRKAPAAETITPRDLLHGLPAPVLSGAIPMVQLMPLAGRRKRMWPPYMISMRPSSTSSA